MCFKIHHLNAYNSFNECRTIFFTAKKDVMVDTGSKFQIYTAVYITETMEQWFLLKTIMVHDWLGRSVLLPIGERLQNAYWPPNLN